jgi:hypothetical protein
MNEGELPRALREPLSLALSPEYREEGKETMTANDVVQRDLDAICTHAQDELRALAGHAVLITGGAGVLG